MSGWLIALLVIGGFVVVLFGGCVVCVALAGRTASHAPAVTDAGSGTSPSPPVAPSTPASAERLERGHPPFYAALAQLAKNPHAAAPESEKDEMFQDIPYTFYTYGHRPLDIPIDHLELHVRKSNHAAWSIIVRPESDPGLFVDDFAPAGGTQSIGTDVKNGDSLDEMIKGTAMEFTVNKGPLTGCILFLFGNKTFAVKSHAEAYPHG